MSFLPGLPPLSLDFRSAFFSVASALGISIPFAASSQGAQWGLYDADGELVITADSVISFGYQKDWSIPNYPQERGAFAAYNKVNRPFEIRIQLSQGGNEETRADFLAAAEAIGPSLDLYQAVTPEATYANVNITHIGMNREQRQGATRIVLDIWLQEVRQSASEVGMTADNVQSVNSVTEISAGQVQAIEPTPLQERVFGLD